jgi:Secretion system C-terminal sorting domain
LLRPYAEAIRNNPVSSETKIALTSTYNYLADYNFNPPQGGGLGTITQRFADIFQGLIGPNSQCPIDLINFHQYSNEALRRQGLDDAKVQTLMGISSLMLTRTLPAVRAAIQNGPCENLGLVITELHTSSMGGTSQQQNSMTEGMYFAEAFASAAEERVQGLTPFATFKEINNVGPVGISNNDPSDPNSFLPGETDFNTHFYFNSEQIDQTYTNIFVKPVFLLKKMLAEHLGSQILPFTRFGVFPQTTANEWNFVGSNPAVVGSFNYENVHVLPTRNNLHLFALVINRSIPNVGPQDIILRVDGQPLVNPSIMTVYGTSILDKRPNKTNGTGGYTNSSNSDDPIFNTATVKADGSISVLPFSVNIIRAEIPRTPECVTISSHSNGQTNVQLNNFTVTWTIPPFNSAASFRVLIGTSQNMFDLVNQIVPGATNSFTFSGTLPICTEVYIRILPIAANGCEGICPPIEIHTTCNQTPPPPCNDNITSPINLANVQQFSVVTWSPAPNATGYTITVQNASGTVVYTGTTVAVTQHAIADVLPSCEVLTITVTPFNSAGAAQNCPSVAVTVCQDVNITVLPGQTISTIDWPPSPATGYIAGASLGTVIVNPGVTLVISSDDLLEFCTNGQMIIQPGAQVNHFGMMTSCGASWRGVLMPEGLNSNGQVIGGGMTLGQNTLSSNTGLIENALIGIDFRLGGVLMRAGAKFRNCRIGIRNSTEFYNIYPKVLPLPSAPKPGYVGGTINISGGLFTVDNAYGIPTVFFAHMDLHNLNGAFLAWTQYGITRFENVMTNPPPENYGIKTTGSRIRLHGNGENLIFSGHTYGVHTGLNAYAKSFYVGNPTTPLPPTIPAYPTDRRIVISAADFHECAVGIFDRTSSANTYVRNRFYMGHIPSAYLGLFGNPLRPRQIGISAESNVWSFSILLNQFIKNKFGSASNVKTTIGTNMSGIGVEENIINNNDFYDVAYGNLATGNNGQQLGTKGLKYECNNMTRLNYDVLAEPIAGIQPTLRSVQGTRLPNNQFQSAGNCFTDPNISTRQFKYNRADMAKIEYFWLAQNCIAQPTKVDFVDVKQATSPTASGCIVTNIPGFEGSGPATEGLSWSPALTTENRQNYYAAFEAQNTASDQATQDYYAERSHLYALAGYRAALADSIQGFDSVMVWLDRIHSFQAEIAKAELILGTGQTDDAFTCFNNIPNKFSLADQEQLDWDGLHQVWNIMLSITPENRVEKLADLEQIATGPIGFGSAYAKNILESEGWHFPPLFPELIDTEDRDALSNETDDLNSISIKFQPNPTSGWLAFQLSQPITDHQSYLQLVDPLGRMINEMQLLLGQTNGQLDLSQLDAGIYLFRLMRGQHVVEAQTILILK